MSLNVEVGAPLFRYTLVMTRRATGPSAIRLSRDAPVTEAPPQCRGGGRQPGPDVAERRIRPAAVPIHLSEQQDVQVSIIVVVPPRYGRARHLRQPGADVGEHDGLGGCERDRDEAPEEQQGEDAILSGHAAQVA